MATVTISGSSDDLVHVEGIEGGDEFNTDGSWVGVIESPNGDTALLYVEYRENGCWTSTLGLFEEGYTFPEWPLTVRASDVNDYSTFTTIEVPDGTTVRPWN